MSQVSVRREHQLGIEGAKAALGAFADDLAKRGAKLEWSGPRAAVKGPGVSGDITVSESAVEVQIKLGMLARAAGIKADKLQASIEKRLAAALQSAD